MTFKELLSYCNENLGTVSVDGDYYFSWRYTLGAIWHLLPSYHGKYKLAIQDDSTEDDSKSYYLIDGKKYQKNMPLQIFIYKLEEMVEDE